MAVEVIILAAGKGTRMRSSLPKVLHRLAGKPLVAHVIERARNLEADKVHVVIGHGAEQVRDTLGAEQVQWAVQEEQLGTGHAVHQATPAIADDAVALILYGDVPLIRSETLNHLLDLVDEKHMALLTVHMDDPAGYGRIIRDGRGDITAIVEQKDATPEQLAIHEVNTGILAVHAAQLKEWLPQLSSDNAQGEYYLTDIIGMAVQNGVRVRGAQPDYLQEVQGINDRVQLAALERWYQARLAEGLMRSGATLRDPARIDVRGDVETGQDVEIDVNVVLSGRVRIGDRVRIGANVVIVDAEIADGAEILENTVLEDCRVGENCVVGPFARLRPGTELAAGAKVGNFVETKKARVGEGSKINHLSYVGDAELGRNVNVGAGTITCNYDGANKHRTDIGDDVFIGSNSSLVAPLRIGDGATVGAGSTITSEVEDGALGVARGKQRNIPNWKRPLKLKKKD